MCSRWIKSAIRTTARMGAVAGLLLLVGTSGCGEDTPGEPIGEQEPVTESGIVVTDRAVDTSGLPGCDQLRALLSPDAQVVVPAAQHGQVAVVYDHRQAVCSSTVKKLFSIGVITPRDLADLNQQLGENPLGSGDPIPAKDGTLESGDPIPAKEGKNDKSKSSMMSSATPAR